MLMWLPCLEKRHERPQVQRTVGPRLPRQCHNLQEDTRAHDPARMVSARLCPAGLAGSGAGGVGPLRQCCGRRRLRHGVVAAAHHAARRRPRGVAISGRSHRLVGAPPVSAGGAAAAHLRGHRAAVEPRRQSRPHIAPGAPVPKPFKLCTSALITPVNCSTRGIPSQVVRRMHDTARRHPYSLWYAAFQAVSRNFQAIECRPAQSGTVCRQQDYGDALSRRDWTAPNQERRPRCSPLAEMAF